MAPRDEAGHVTIRAIRLTEPFALDGRLDERLYHDTNSITDFVQHAAGTVEGKPATDKTEVWVAYDADAVYVGARLWESDPSKRVTSDMPRDTRNLYQNDHFAVMRSTTGATGTSFLRTRRGDERRAGHQREREHGLEHDLGNQCRGL